MKRLALAVVLALVATVAISRAVTVEYSDAIVEGIEAPDHRMFPFPAVVNDGGE